MIRSTMLFVAGFVLFAFCGAFAHAGGCPPGSICVTIPAGSTAEDIVDLLEDAWNAGDFDCKASATPGKIVMEGTDGERTITYQIPAGATDLQHDMQYRLVPSEFSHEAPPFQIFLTYDNRPEKELQDGPSIFDEMILYVDTPTGHGGGTTGLPGLNATDPARTAMLVAGLLLLGAVYVLVRRV